jgi:hypothetical protein
MLSVIASFHLRHPDVIVFLWQANEHPVAGDAEVRLFLEVDGSLALGIVKVLLSEG